MPMVETSVAVAIPSMTAKRMTKGRISAGRAMMKVRAMMRRRGAAHAADVVVPRAVASEQREGDGEQQRGQQAAGEQRGDRNAGDGADGDEHERGRDRLAHRARCRQQGDQLAFVDAAPFHLGKQHRRDGRHVGGLGAGDAGDEVHRAQQHVAEPAPDVAEQGGEEGDHRGGHAGHLYQQAEEDEERNGEQDQRAHALVHARDDDRQRDVRRQAEIAERREAEGEGDRDAGEDGESEDGDEEDDEVPIADMGEHGGRANQQGDEDREQEDRREQFARRASQQPQRAIDQHQRDAHRDGAGAPHVRQPERRRRDRRLFLRVADRVGQQEAEEQRRRADGEGVRLGLAARVQAGDERGEAHVGASPERDDAAQHRQPEEQDRGQLVGPDERAVDDIARDHAGEQDDDLGDDQEGAGEFDGGVEQALSAGDRRDAHARGRAPTVMLALVASIHAFEDPQRRGCSAFAEHDEENAALRAATLTPACRRWLEAPSTHPLRTSCATRHRTRPCGARRGTARHRPR